MDRKTFREWIEAEIRILDGAMGTLLLPKLPPGASIERINLDNPDIVRSVYGSYVDAGADVISTNTFGANRIKLEEFGLAGNVREINEKAARLAKSAAGGKAWVAGTMGPSGKLVEPLGPMTFNGIYESFREQAVALAQGGADMLLLETFSDLREIKAAVMAARDNTGLPVLASMTFGEDFLTFTGTDPSTAANVLASLGVDAVGINCSTGPGPMLEVLGRYLLVTDKPLFLEPNAGLPRWEDRTVAFQVSPDEMAFYAEKFAGLGANLIGTCCGSTPLYTAALVKRLKGKRPVSRKTASCLRLSSRVRTVEIGRGLPFCIIGERINPTNREDLTEEIRSGRLGLLLQEAQSQAEEGARVLDVNIGVPGIDEPAMMKKAVQGIENVTPAPLCIDHVHPAVIEAALMECAGKPLLNSVNGDEKSRRALLALAAKYGAGVLCLAVNELGIPRTAEERVSVLKSIVTHAEKAGIDRRDLICDCLTLTVSAEQKRAEETLRAMRMVKEDMGLPAVLGVSNISYGLPERSLVNSVFLSMAMASGLDAAIMNPGDARMKETVRAASVLTVRDRDSREFVRSHLSKKKSQKAGDAVPAQTIESGIYHSVLQGNRDEIGGMVRKALDSGKSPLEINERMLVPAIEEVGRRYEAREIYLPQMILAAETMQKGFEILEPLFQKDHLIQKGVILLCTVRGDVHDIGKNIVALFLKNQGYHVIDLGKDVPAGRIVEAALAEKADVVGLSALMTTTMTEMPVVIDAIRKSGSGSKVIVGGAVVNKRFADEIGADGYARDGVGAVDLIKALTAVQAGVSSQD
ncbi:homocysteine S-methyltransferase family protein [bacterium]|nr:homocysteine S-methyltransferase family protein [bacterium]